MTFKQTLGMLCVIGVSSACYAEHRALLVGIDNYQSLNRLVGSKQDVKNMKQFIQSEWGYQSRQIRTLTDAQATRTGILGAFDNWLIRGSQPGDKVLFYYSGHGYFLKDDDYDEGDGHDEVLCPVNAYQTSDGQYINFIRDDEINRRLRQLTGRQVMVIVDACHSGTITKSAFRNRFVKVPYFRRQPRRRLTKSGLKREKFVETQQNVVAYSAVAPHQEALVDSNVWPPAGVFTRRFIEGLQQKKADRNYDGKVSHRELLAYTRRESEAYCKRQYFCRDGLTPQLAIKSGMLDKEVRAWLSAHPALPTPPMSTYPTSEFIPTPVVDDLHVEILPSRLRRGTKMRFQITTDQKDGYLLLFDASETGGAETLVRLFPNRHTGNIRLKAGKPRVIPDQLSGCEISAKSPGQRLLVALLVNNRHELSTLQRSLQEAFSQVMPKKRRGLSRLSLSQLLSQQLNKILLQKNVGNRVKWSLTTVSYEIR
jgi:metacaspase-1